MIRTAKLWQLMCSWYSRTNPPSKLQKLTVEMLRQQGKGPKLRTKAGECKYLIPFCAEIIHQFKGVSLHLETVANAMDLLRDMYDMIDMEPYPAVQVAEICHQFSLLYAALHAEAVHQGRDLYWVIKPKFHLMIELLEIDCVRDGQSPRRFWTYLDESWGGELANIAIRRGGPKRADSLAENIIQRYRAWVSR